MTSPIIAATMRAAEISEYGKPYQIVKRPIPKIRENEILIRVHAAGFCHSDLQVLQGHFGSPLGMIPSHEPAGIIELVGSQCNKDWQVGDRVGALNFKHSCGHCRGCTLTQRNAKQLDPRFCDRRETAGFHHDGAFADYLVADPDTMIRLPPSLPMNQAAPLMCAGATIWGSLEKVTAGLVRGDTIAIIGIGGLGHLGIQFAATMGYRVVAVDNRVAGQRVAREVPHALQPALVVDLTASNAVEQVLEFTDGEGVAAAVVSTDSAAAHKLALQMLRIRGVMGLLGLPADGWHFDSNPIIFKEITIHGTYVASRQATERMMEAVEQAGIRSHIQTMSFEEIPSILDAYQASGFRGRLVVQIGEE